MSGILGWSGVVPDDAKSTLARMAGGASVDGIAIGDRDGSTAAAVRGSVPAVVHEARGVTVAIVGHPRWRANAARSEPLQQLASALLQRFLEDSHQALAALDGDYALAITERERERVTLAVDRMSVRNIVYAEVGGGIAFGPTCDAVLRFPGVDASVDPQALYDYLYFHMVPGPGTVYRALNRVPSGSYVVFDNGRRSLHAHWQPRFVEDARFDFDAQRRAFRSALEDSVGYAGDGTKCGAFLSGGTDSSTIAGFLGRRRGGAAPTFSIGFDAAGYDEMRYARIAAKHFGTEQHEYYVTPADVVAAIPRVADAYDQPFGNASAVPTYYCAKLARDCGIERMLGGDGGDELYGGNVRYAKQHQFAYYESVPAPVRSLLLDPIASLPFASSVPLLRKARSYVEQARLPMPDRYESYNLLERLGPSNVLCDDFLAGVDTSGPLRRMRSTWSQAQADSLVNRMLALDFKFTLADNDLPKVTRMCELAGVDVAFPMLSADVIDLSLSLPPSQKLRGTQLRYFFKRALDDFLPPEILAKEKHGFGLPVGAWLVGDAKLKELAGDTLSRLRSRGIVRPAFIDGLLSERLARHAGYYGTMVWVLMMLELWHARQPSHLMQPA